MRDREFLIGIFNMVGMILQQMTGKIPVVRLHGEDGVIQPTYYNIGDIDLINPEVEVVDQPYVHLVSHSTCCSNHGELDAKEKESQQLAGK